LKKFEASIKKQSRQVDACKKQLELAKTAAQKIQAKFDKDNQKRRAKLEAANEKVANLENEANELANK
jgi:hypothetical protein